MLRSRGKFPLLGFLGGVHRMRYFNTEGLCRPEMHYMVRLDNMLAQIRQQYVDRGSYFVINKGRQYGKTTLLRALAENLKDTYIVIMLDFQKMMVYCWSLSKDPHSQRPQRSPSL